MVRRSKHVQGSSLRSLCIRQSMEKRERVFPSFILLLSKIIRPVKERTGDKDDDDDASRRSRDRREIKKKKKNKPKCREKELRPQKFLFSLSSLCLLSGLNLSVSLLLCNKNEVASAE